MRGHDVDHHLSAQLRQVVDAQEGAVEGLHEEVHARLVLHGALGAGGGDAGRVLRGSGS
jgi:hypothetical protein